MIFFVLCGWCSHMRAGSDAVERNGFLQERSNVVTGRSLCAHFSPWAGDTEAETAEDGSAAGEQERTGEGDAAMGGATAAAAAVAAGAHRRRRGAGAGRETSAAPSFARPTCRPDRFPLSRFGAHLPSSA